MPRAGGFPERENATLQTGSAEVTLAGQTCQVCVAGSLPSASLAFLCRDVTGEGLLREQVVIITRRPAVSLPHPSKCQEGGLRKLRSAGSSPDLFSSVLFGGAVHSGFVADV